MTDIPPFPISPVQIVMTVSVCVIAGIIFMGALLKRKKKLAQKYQDEQEKPKSDKKNDIPQ